MVLLREEQAGVAANPLYDPLVIGEGEGIV